LSDAKDLLREVSLVLKGLSDRLGDRCGNLNPPIWLVVRDLETERLEHPALELHRRLAERVAQVGQPRE